MVSFIHRLPALFLLIASAGALQLKGPDGADQLDAAAGTNDTQKQLDHASAAGAENDAQKHVTTAATGNNEPRKQSDKPGDLLHNLKLSAGPAATYHDLKDGVHKLQHSISVEQETALVNIRTRKAEYESKLFVQRADSESVANFNAFLLRKIRGVEQEIGRLRGQADDFTVQNDRLAEELKTMQKNISTAHAFVNQALEYSADKLEHSPELDVLAEMDEMDKSAARERELKAFAGLPHLSVLRLNASPANAPEDIVQRLNATLGDASARLEDNLAKLSATFDKLFSEGESRRQQLLETQAELNSTLATKTQYKERMSQAVQHLAATQKDLSKRINAIRVFGKDRLGAAFLQVGAQDVPGTGAKGNVSEGQQALAGSRGKQQGAAQHEVLTGMHLQAGTTQTYKDLFSGVSNLQGSIEGEQRQALQSIRTKKEEYAQLLLKQRAGNEEWASMNAIITQKLHGLQREVKDLRREANGLVKDNQRLTGELQTMRKNISMASEFVDQAVDAAKVQLENASQLQVLTELASFDRETAHEMELKTFAGVSMLHIVGEGESAGHAPENILSRIEFTLSDAAAEREAAMTKLADTYKRLHEEGQAQRKVLMDKQEELNATVETTQATKEKLIKAVKYLKDTKAQLSSRVDAIRAFGRLQLGADTGAVVSRSVIQKESRHKSVAKKEKQAPKNVSAQETVVKEVSQAPHAAPAQIPTVQTFEQSQQNTVPADVNADGNATDVDNLSP